MSDGKRERSHTSILSLLGWYGGTRSWKFERSLAFWILSCSVLVCVCEVLRGFAFHVAQAHWRSCSTVLWLLWLLKRILVLLSFLFLLCNLSFFLWQLVRFFSLPMLFSKFIMLCLGILSSLYLTNSIFPLTSWKYSYNRCFQVHVC